MKGGGRDQRERDRHGGKLDALDLKNGREEERVEEGKQEVEQTVNGLSFVSRLWHVNRFSFA